MLPPPKRYRHPNAHTFHNFKSDDDIRHLSSRSDKRIECQQITSNPLFSIKLSMVTIKVVYLLSLHPVWTPQEVAMKT